MLKDKLSNFLKEKEKKNDPINLSIMDGFVNIKGYKVSDDGTKKLVYHDCGDNVVTDWMRHTLMLLLTGDSFTKKGRERYSLEATLTDNDEQISTISSENHNSSLNQDGYILNGKQYFWNYEEAKPTKYSKASDHFIDNKYALFPTKILFGTGTEYNNWETLRSENEVSNPEWYSNIRKLYSKTGSSEQDIANTFNKNINLGCNVFSGTIAKNVYSGDGTINKARTVNGPDTYYDTTITTSSMNKNYGVVGAIKTPYYSPADNNKLEKNASTDNGRLLLPEWAGVGRPCFLYLDIPEDEKHNKKEGWSDPTSDVYLSKDDSSKFLNKITFKIVMPSQSASNDSIGKYYPYNGYKLKQMGLYNDSLMVNSTDSSGDDKDEERLQNNMPCGTLLAVKNIAPLSKTADMELVITWTLTI